jgi:hypothetical protein
LPRLRLNSSMPPPRYGVSLTVVDVAIAMSSSVSWARGHETFHYADETILMPREENLPGVGRDQGYIAHGQASLGPFFNEWRTPC